MVEIWYDCFFGGRGGGLLTFELRILNLFDEFLI